MLLRHFSVLFKFYIISFGLFCFVFWIVDCCIKTVSLLHYTILRYRWRFTLFLSCVTRQFVTSFESFLRLYFFFVVVVSSAVAHARHSTRPDVAHRRLALRRCSCAFLKQAFVNFSKLRDRSAAGSVSVSSSGCCRYPRSPSENQIKPVRSPAYGCRHSRAEAACASANLRRAYPRRRVYASNQNLECSSGRAPCSQCMSRRHFVSTGFKVIQTACRAVSGSLPTQVKTALNFTHF